MTDEERAVWITELRLHGVHPTWIEWAVKNDYGCAEFMRDVLDGVTSTPSSAYLAAAWKRPLNTDNDDEYG